MGMKADLIITGNCIFDSVRDEPFDGFVALAAGRILQVGQGQDYKDWRGENTIVYDAADRTVMAGFHDSHTHLVMAGMYLRYPNLGAARSEEETVSVLKRFYDENDPGEEWVYGFNWYHVFWDDKKLPTRDSLDKVFPDRPVFLLDAEAHGAWVNSRALEIAGIDDFEPDKDGVVYERDAAGRVTGFLSETAVEPVVKHAFRFSYEQEKALLLAYMKRASEYGITSVTDVRPYFGTEVGSVGHYERLAEEEGLTVRIHTAGNLFNEIQVAIEENRNYHSDVLRTNYLKQFVDGVITTHTAYMGAPYADMPDYCGVPVCDLQVLREKILTAHEHGFSVKLHAIGDAAITFCLDSFEEAYRRYGDTGARHCVEHIEYAKPEDIPRFGKLGVIASMQPEHVGLLPTWEGEEYRFVLGEERAWQVWRFASILRSGGVLAIGSDCPVVDNNPFFEINRALTRLHDDGLPEGGWVPEEKLTIPQILKAYTWGSAFACGREDELGTLEEGKMADIVVLDRDIFKTSAEEIRCMRTDLTIMGGQVVFERRNEDVI